MRWFKRTLSRPSQELKPPIIKFVGEQDGSSERELKDRFVEQFRGNATVLRAYLARADYGDAAGPHVTLCVRSAVAKDKALVGRVADIFAALFGSHEHLDILLIRDDQEAELRRVCKPFYEAE